jgi:AcrR family transcriptional regulator
VTTPTPASELAPGTAASTRDAILDAAERLFAERGFDGTTIKQLGAAARVNTALLYYYFEDKEQLYHAVFHRVLGRLSQRGTSQMDAAASPADAVRRLVAMQAEFLGANPYLPRLFMRGLLEFEARPGLEEVRVLAEGVFKRLCEVIRDGQRSGVFRAELDPRLAAVSTVAQVAYLILARPLVGVLLDGSPDALTTARVRDFARHAGDFAVAALSVPAAEPTPPARRARARRTPRSHE